MRHEPLRLLLQTDRGQAAHLATLALSRILFEGVAKGVEEIRNEGRTAHTRQRGSIMRISKSNALLLRQRAVERYERMQRQLREQRELLAAIAPAVEREDWEAVQRMLPDLQRLAA